MGKIIIKGNEAIAMAALNAGLDAFFGYPITPSSEIPETLAKFYPKRLKVFLQAESEVASVNMMLGGSACGSRVMTATSSPGFSLMQEGISYMGGSRLPGVFVNVMRGGPGLGNIGGEQSDFNQMVKGGGHGGYRLPVFAPNSAQEMYDLTIRAFDVADKYRTPVIVTTDGYLGQMKEAIVISDTKVKEYDKAYWTTVGAKNREPHIITSRKTHIITSIHLAHNLLESHQNKLYTIYDEIKINEVDFEKYRTDDADIIFVAYGIVSRIVKGVINKARDRGMKAGLFRPKTLWPFPVVQIQKLSKDCDAFLAVELSKGQMVNEVEHAVFGERPVYFYGRSGGNLPSEKEILKALEGCYDGKL